MANEKEEEIEDEVRKTYSRAYFWSDRTEYKFASRWYLRSSRENAHQNHRIWWVVAKFVNFFSFSLSVLPTNKINFLWRAHLSLSLYRRNTPRKKKTRRSTTTVCGVFLYICDFTRACTHETRTSSSGRRKNLFFFRESLLVWKWTNFHLHLESDANADDYVWYLLLIHIKTTTNN